MVPYTSGVEICATLQSTWQAIRNMLMMCAFPLFALVAIREKGMFRDHTLVMARLIALFAMLEAMFFRETGLRINHGNFNWASMSAALLLWVVVMPKFFLAIGDYQAQRAALREQAKAGVIPSAVLAGSQRALSLRSAGFLISIMLLVWHLYSSLFYLYFLLTTNNAF